MVSSALNAHEKLGRVISLWVWYGEDVALAEGQGVCYNWDYGTATVSDKRRSNRVELPTILNARYFAGVAARAYAANTGGQFIEIYAPGSVCDILTTKTSTTIGVGVLTCQAGGTYAGYFTEPGFPGEGTAVPLQTISAAGLCLAKLQEGEPSGLIESVITNTDGLVDGGATTFMVGGVSYCDLEISVSGAATFTLADGTVPGIKKAFVCRATQANDITITVTSGIDGHASSDGTGALGTITLDADLEEISLYWDSFDTSGVWVCQHSVGAGLS